MKCVEGGDQMAEDDRPGRIALALAAPLIALLEDLVRVANHEGVALPAELVALVESHPVIEGVAVAGEELLERGGVALGRQEIPGERPVAGRVEGRARVAERVIMLTVGALAERPFRGPGGGLRKREPVAARLPHVELADAGHRA